MNRRDFIGAVATALPLLPSLMPKRAWRVAERIGDSMYGTDVETGCVVELRDTSRRVRIGDRQFIFREPGKIGYACEPEPDGCFRDKNGVVWQQYGPGRMMMLLDGDDVICRIDVSEWHQRGYRIEDIHFER